MFEELKTDVYKANLDLVKYGLVIFTFGNASAIDREKKIIVIKPSGLSYEKMTENDMVVLDFDANKVEGDLNPSSDTPTHIELYKKFPSIGGIVHTHSTWATIWAQAGKSIPCLGTSHADHFYGNIPCTKKLSMDEISGSYEKNTGLKIIDCYKNSDPLEMPAVLVKNHGPFSFGIDVAAAVYNAVILEDVAKMAYHTVLLGKSEEISKDLLDKHFKRKHGKNAYYGQNDSN